MELNFHRDTLVRENGFTNLRGDGHNENKNYFAVDVEDANGKVDVNIGLESVREGIAGGLSAIVFVKLDVDVYEISVGERWRNRFRRELVAEEDVAAGKEAGSKDR